MLVKLSCDKFRKDANGNPESFTFKDGLNVVLGTADSKNSIGKSTLLLLIDFMFGGDDYKFHNNIAVRKIGHHLIHAYFEFEGKEYHYARGTHNPEEVYFYNDNGEVEATLSNNEYLKQLHDFYKVTDDMTFREAVAPYLRIYQRETTNEKYPINAAFRQPKDKAIEIFLKLFGSHKQLDSLKEEIETLEDQISTFKKSSDYKYVEKIDKKKYEKNLKTIDEYTQKLGELRKQYLDGTYSKDYQENKEAITLLTAIESLKATKSQYENQIKNLEKIKNKSSKDFESDLEELKLIFPGFEFKHLTDIEDFHQKLTSIFNEQSENERKKALKSIAKLDEQIAELEDKYKKIVHIEKTVPEAVFQEMLRFETDIRRLSKQNELYVENSTNKETLGKKQEKLATEGKTSLIEVQNIVNGKIAEINRNFYAGQRQAPNIRLSELNKYYFTIPDDEGTGSSQRALIMFDIAVLMTSQLPLLAHDSIISKQIEDYSIQEIIKLYSTIKGKQIFMVYDGNKNLDQSAQAIINQATRVTLGADSQSLFGVDFSK